MKFDIDDEVKIVHPYPEENIPQDSKGKVEAIYPFKVQPLYDIRLNDGRLIKRCEDELDFA